MKEYRDVAIASAVGAFCGWTLVYLGLPHGALVWQVLTAAFGAVVGAFLAYRPTEIRADLLQGLQAYQKRIGVQARSQSRMAYDTFLAYDWKGLGMRILSILSVAVVNLAWIALVSYAVHARLVGAEMFIITALIGVSLFATILSLVIITTMLDGLDSPFSFVGRSMSIVTGRVFEWVEAHEDEWWFGYSIVPICMVLIATMASMVVAVFLEIALTLIVGATNVIFWLAVSGRVAASLGAFFGAVYALLRYAPAEHGFIVPASSAIATGVVVGVMVYALRVWLFRRGITKFEIKKYESAL